MKNVEYYSCHKVFDQILEKFTKYKEYFRVIFPTHMLILKKECDSSMIQEGYII